MSLIMHKACGVPCSFIYKRKKNEQEKEERKAGRDPKDPGGGRGGQGPVSGRRRLPAVQEARPPRS